MFSLHLTLLLLQCLFGHFSLSVLFFSPSFLTTSVLYFLSSHFCLFSRFQTLFLRCFCLLFRLYLGHIYLPIYLYLSLLVFSLSPPPPPPLLTKGVLHFLFSPCFPHYFYGVFFYSLYYFFPFYLAI